MKKDEILKIENLKKYFPMKKGFAELFSRKKSAEFFRAVDDVSFTLNSGEILGFVGESGCGKTTLGRTLLRLVEPTSGKITFDGVDVTKLSRKDMKKMRKNMQMIFQDPFGSLNPRRTVSETVKQTIRIHKMAHTRQEENDLIKSTLEDVELKPAEEYWAKYPDLLSGGQRQRVCLGRVMALEPKFIVADEPISMLDVSVRIGILDLMKKMQEEHGTSFVYITHDLISARYICDRIAIMYLGKIVEMGETEKVIHNPLHPYTRALITAVPLPDPEEELSDVPIKGYVPMSADQKIVGCRFHPRCPVGQDKCLKEDKKLIEVDEDHYVACTANFS
ncbi:MAG: ABC transporter ATP-binding protein [Desulfobacterales bacterium]|nr:ABC transporter ATP-binding protein [Desulfobacterales bacterium]